MSVSLAVFSEWERVFTLYGWLFNNFLTEILFSSGLVLAVMIMVLIPVGFAAVGTGGATHRTTQTMHASLELRVLAVVLILLFAFFPMFKVDEVRVLDRTDTCQEYGKHAAFTDVPVYESLRQELIEETDDVKIPLLWALIHKIGAGIYYQIFEGLDCFTDWSAIETIIRTNKIQDLALLDEYHRFASQCYGQARARYQRMGHEGGGVPPNMEDLAYIGGSYYLDTPGYYSAFLLPATLRRWQPNLVRSCVAWWQGDAVNKGLREILFEQAIAGLPSLEMAQILAHRTDELGDRVIKAMLKSNVVALAAADPTRFNKESPDVSQLVYGAGAGLSDFSERISATLYRADFLNGFVSYVQPIILFLLYFFSPLFLLASGLRVTAILYYAVWLVGVQAIPTIYAIVAALDSKILANLYQEVGLFNVTMDRLLIAYIFSYLPLVLVIAYLLALNLAISRGISRHLHYSV